MDSKKKWFVFYTKSRQEKKVDEFLQKHGYKTFLPTHKVIRQWSDRKKKIEVPLFNSYIFIQEEEHRIPEILQTPGLAWNIRVSGKPAVLREGELEIIKRFVATGLTIETASLDEPSLHSGDRAKIIDGPLKGIEGTVIGNADDQTFTVALEGIDQFIRVQIPSFLLKKL